MGAHCEAGAWQEHNRRAPVFSRWRNPRDTELLNLSREQALGRLKDHAKELGANAVIGVESDSSEIGYMTELLAYGTAVVVERETEKTSPVRLG